MDGTELRALVEAERERFGVAGLSVVVIRDGEVVVADGFGTRDKTDDLPATPTTLFALASDTKHFVAAACALLVEDGLLEWDRPVRDYLPDFALHDPHATALVTLRDLLAHRTGLPRHDALNAWSGTRLSPEEVVRRLRHLQPSAALRQTYQYNNLAYVTAGHLLGVLTGGDWETVVQTRLLDPLGMTATCFSREVAEKTGDIAVGYDMDGVAVPKRGEGRRGPAGGILSNAEDVARWLLARLGRPTEGGCRVLSDAALTALTTPSIVEPVGLARFPEIVKTGYALGTSTVVYRGVRVVHHGGNIDGFCSDLLLAPDRGHAIGVVANISGSGVRDAIPLAVLDRLLGLDPLPWGERWHALMSSYRGGALAARDQLRAAPEGGPPSRPLADFAGRYAHPAYDVVDVSVDPGGDALRVSYHGYDDIEVTHKDVDVWDLQVPGYDLALTMSFRAGPHGVEDLVIPLEPMVDPIVFVREPAVLTDAEVSRLVGAYSMGDIALDVARDGDLLVAEIPGMVRAVLQARDALRFTVPGRSGLSVTFTVDDAGRVERLLLAPFGVFAPSAAVDG
ncbi:MAG TPA: serine hydrolase [Mycobacteriales bacterium]|nr:serine hydrolase [Mycobacteriales bacterium]